MRDEQHVLFHHTHPDMVSAKLMHFYETIDIFCLAGSAQQGLAQPSTHLAEGLKPF